MIQVINRALDILEFVAEEPERPRSLSDIAEHFTLNSGTCANIIKTLVTRKYLLKLDKKKGYVLGPKSYGLTKNDEYKKDLTEAAREVLEVLTKKLNENSLLAILENDMRREIVRMMSTHPIQANTIAEKRAYDSSSGRSLIAMLPDIELKRFIKQYGIPKKGEWEGVTSKKTLMSQIAKIRADGYSTQLTSGKIVGLAVPVFQGEKVIASLSIYMPEYRYNKSNKMEVVNLLKHASKNLSSKLA